MPNEKKESLGHVVAQIRACTACIHPEAAPILPHPPRPILQISDKARLLIAGQAPGNLVNQTGHTLQRSLRRSSARMARRRPRRFL